MCACMYVCMYVCAYVAIAAVERVQFSQAFISQRFCMFNVQFVLVVSLQCPRRVFFNRVFERVLVVFSIVFAMSLYFPYAVFTRVFHRVLTLFQFCPQSCRNSLCRGVLIMFVFLSVWLSVFLSVRLYVCMYVCKHACMYIRMYVCV